MTAIETAKTNRNSRKATLDIVRPLTGRRALLVAILTAAAIAGVAAMNWSWLVAIGAVSILVSVLPCLLMCGLGLCMSRFSDRTGANSCEPPTDETNISTRPMSENLFRASVSPRSGGVLWTAEDRSPQSREKTDA